MTTPPNDFGLDPVRTLARVGDPTPARDHSVFWGEWFRRLGADRPELRARAPGADPSDPSATHEFTSVGGVRVGCRLLVPGGACLGGVVAAHGAVVDAPMAADDDRWRALVERGVAVAIVRVRGYPGSRLDTPDLPTDPGAWFTHGLDAPDADAWVVPHAAADLANACRALRNALHGRTPGVTPRVEAARPMLALHGESLGAGLAVIVAAQLVGRLRHERIVERLAIGVPSMGDWPWRLEHPAGGNGAAVRVLLERAPDRRDAIAQRVRLCDAVVHAHRARGTVLCKLAERDEVVPAPSAAAVFNAMGSDPGEKWRFVVPVGHAEAGVGNARRHAVFERCVADFLDPARDPREAMEAWEPVLSSGERAPAARDPEPAPTLFGADVLTRDRDAALIRAYERAGRTLDSLPYTETFETVVRESGSASGSEREVLHRLHTLRKAGRLPRLGRAGERPPTIETDHERVLRGLVMEACGSMGARDRLPYTESFDRLAERFQRETGLALGRHELWRVIAKLAK